MNRFTLWFRSSVLMLAIVWTTLAAARQIAGKPARYERAPERPAAHANPSSAADCPRGARPGEILWSYRRLNGYHFTLAIGDDGTVYVPTANGKLYAVGCRGNLRWQLDARSELPPAARLEIFYTGPLIGDDGRLYLVGLNGGAPSRILTLETSGALRWSDSPVSYAEGELQAPLALDHQGRIFTGIRRYPDIFSFSALLAFDRFGGPVAGFPIETTRMLGPMLVLADGRLAFLSAGSSWAGRLPATPDRPPRPASTATPVWPDTELVYVPLAWTNRWTAATTEPPVDPQTLPVFPPTRLTLLDPSHPDRVSHLNLEASGGHLMAVGDVVIVDLGQDRRLAAFAVDTNPPRLLWEHTLRSTLSTHPVLGRHDEATGTSELVYLGDDGSLVSLQVPDTPASTAVPRFNWAVSVEAKAGTNSGLALGDAGLLYLIRDTTVRAIDRKDGSEVWTLPLKPNVDRSVGTLNLGPGGILYVDTYTGIIAISTESGGLDPEAAWPAAMHDQRNTGRADR